MNILIFFSKTIKKKFMAMENKKEIQYKLGNNLYMSNSS